MKTIGKIIILISVMLLISGGFYISMRNMTGGRGGEGFERREGGQRPPGFEGEREGFEGRERGGFGIFSILAIVPELLKVSVVALIVYWLKKGYDNMISRKASPPAAG